MPMDTLTLLQTVEVFGAYLFVTAWLPAFVFGKKLREHRLIERFLIYYMIGNFYVINLVYTLQLLKISYPATLALFTFVPAVLGRMILNKTPVRQIVEDRLSILKKVVQGSMGRRTALFRIFGVVKRQVKAGARFVGGLVVHHGLDCLAMGAFLGLLLWLHGTNLLESFGYKASDLPVHNFWINAMGENHIFVAGVYPHGFHCVIYYFHALFGFATMNLLRLFGFVQAVMVNMVLLLFLKLCCKSRFAPYIGAFLYAGSRYLAEATYSRFYAALPQEFGMIFIFPTVYFGFAYFEARRRELGEKERPERKERKKRFELPWKRRAAKAAGTLENQEVVEADTAAGNAEAEGLAGTAGPDAGSGFAAAGDASPQAMEAVGPPQEEEKTAAVPEEEAMPPKRRRLFRRRKKPREKRRWEWRETYLYLAGFAMSFSMTLTVHFYGAMIAGLFCLAMALGYLVWFVRKEFFTDIILTCLLSVFVAVLPMVTAYLGGTPLQGSLGWGLNVIRQSQEQVAAAETGAGTETGTNTGTGTGTAPETGTGGAAAPPAQPKQEEVKPPPTMKERLEKLKKGVEDRWKTFRRAIYRPLDAAVLRLPSSKYINWVIVGFAVLIGLGAVLFFLRQYCYGAMLISTGLFLFLMGIMMSARTFGLPALMDANRGGIYYAYSLPLLAAFLADGALVLAVPFRHKFWKVLRNGLSLVLAVLVIWHTWATGQLRLPRHPNGMEMNEAIICVQNIIETEADFTWTIVSANDELRMTTDYGYHVETITFLEDMEGPDGWTKIRIRIPTPVVYIFIEKIPLDYFESYEGSGQTISEEGANRRLPGNSGISMYQGEKRWILMSRMYYWAQEFQRLYPNELDVYLETDRFVCYRIEQNMYRLYDFAIDYDYNTRDYDAAEESA